MTGRRTVFFGGPIRTADPARPRASSLTVVGGTIAFVGEPGAAPPPPVAGEERIDLAGRTLLPGLVDAHTHLVHWGFRFLRPDLSEVSGPEELLDRVRDAERRLSAGRPLIGEGWDESGWRERRFPTRRELDAISAVRPIVLRRIDGHLAVANGAALARFPDSPEVDRERGILLEESAMGIARIFPPSADELDEALAAAQRSCFSLGVTQVHDMSLPAHLEAFRRADERGALRLRIAAILPRTQLAALLETGLGVGWSRGPVRTWGTKWFSDGSLGARTAELEADYADAPGVRGEFLLDHREFVEAIARSESHGVRLAVHAIGDRAVRRVIEAFDEALGGEHSRLGHRIEHLEMVDRPLLQRMAHLGITASMQANFIGNWGREGGLYEQRLGAARVARMNPLPAVLEEGVRLVLGSDGMPADPLRGLADAVGAPHAAQRLTAGEGLAAATREASRSGGFDDRGMLREGLAADGVVVSDWPDDDESGDDAAARIRQARIDRVMVDGVVVHRPEESLT